jgi:tetratricopeptide (TPR) repeat protein
MAVTLVAYVPSLHGQFVWDDDAWTTGIAQLFRDWRGLAAILFRPTALQQYYPLSGASFWLDYHLWGWWTLPYHIENVVLHVLGALLFLKVLRRLAVPGAWPAAWIFALHPMMVESVAWITERKNVLSLPLFLGSVLAYLRFSEATNGVASQENRVPTTLHAPRSTLYYYLALVLFVAAYMAKASAFSLPAVLLLICWWKRGRIRWREEIVPLLPFFALSLALSALTVWIEKNHTGAQGRDWAFSFWERCLIAGRALWFYPGKLIWPVNLCFVYPRWRLDTGAVGQWIYPVSALGMMLGLWLARNRIGRGPAVAVFFYAGTLFPVLGFINGYGMRYSFVWDHWAYVSALGLIALGCAGVALLWDKVARLNVKGLQSGIAVLLVALVAALGVLTWRQSGMYRNIETLWRTTIVKNPNAFLALTHLGALLSKDHLEEAIALHKKALDAWPDFAEAHDNLGYALVQKHQLDEALIHFQKALALEPGNPSTHCNCAGVLLEKGQIDDAIVEFRKSLELDPFHSPASYGLGRAFLKKGQLDEAVGYLQRAVEHQPNLVEARNSFANALFQMGRAEEGIGQLREVVKLTPGSVTAHHNLGLALLQAKRLQEAMAPLAKALEIEPNYAKGHSDLGIALLASDKPDEAIAHFQKALEITPTYAEAHYNLAMAFLRKGRPDDASFELQKALELRPQFTEANQALKALQSAKLSQ